MTAYFPVADLYTLNLRAWIHRFPKCDYLPTNPPNSSIEWCPTYPDASIPEATRLLVLQHPDTLPFFYSTWAWKADRAIAIIEPKLSYLRDIFFLYDWRETILSPYVFWFVGDQWEEDLREFIYQHGVFHYPTESCYIFPPSSSFIYDILPSAFTTARNKFNDQWKNFIQKTSPSQSPRIWTHCEPSAAIYQGMTHAYINAIQSQGCSTWVSFLRTGWASDKKILTEFVNFAPDFCFFINGPSQHIFNHLGFPQSMCQKIPSKTITWYVDHPRFLTSSSSKFQSCQQDHIAVCDRAYIPWFQPYRSRSLFHLPHAATLHCQGEYQEHFDYPIVYVGSIINPQNAIETLSAASRETLNRGIHEMQGKRTPLLDFKEYPLEPSIRNELTQCAIQFLQIHMKKSFSDPSQALDYFFYVVATFQRRLSLVKKLLPLGLHIFGPNDWLPLVGDEYSHRVHGTVDQQELADCYASAKMQLNLHSLQCPTAINPRVYDVPYAGGLILTDWVEEMDRTEFRDGEHGVVVKDEKEWRSKIEYYLTHPDERAYIRQNSRSWVLENHTVECRVQTLMHHVRKGEHSS